MNILFLSTWFPYPPDNGSKIRVHHLLNALAARHQVTLLAFAFGTAKPEGWSKLDSLCHRCDAVHLDPHRAGRLARTFRFFSTTPLATQSKPQMRRKVASALEQQPFDVVVASTKGMASYALTVPERTVKVLEEHNAISRQLWERYRQQTTPMQRLRCWVSWRKYRAYESRILSRFDLCTMVSNQDRAATLELTSGQGTRVEVVPNGVDCSHNRLGHARAMPNRLVFNGSLTFAANYHAMQFFVKEIFPLIRKVVPEIVLTITGAVEGVDTASLKAVDGIQLSGYVEDIRSLVASATVCVVPIRQGSGTRLKLLEAMALGTPVVATEKGAEGLDVVDGQHLLIADEPEHFAAQTIALLRNDELRERLRLNARKLVERRYDWANIGQQFVDLVERTVWDDRLP